MNFKANESTTKLRGGYYTSPEIARFLWRWVLEKKPSQILEPSCGDGVFIKTLAEFATPAVERLIGFEIEPSEAEKAHQATIALLHTECCIYNQDFLEWALLQFMYRPQFDAVVGNPPFIRYQYLDKTLQARSQKIFEHFQLPFTKHTNAWVPFVMASLALLRPEGRLAMVLPAELLHVLHAQSLRTFLAGQCQRLLIVDPKQIWFADTLQGAVLLLAEKKRTPQTSFNGMSIVQMDSDDFLRRSPSDLFQTVTYVNGATTVGKWMTALLTPEEQAVLEKIATHPKVKKFTEVADIAVGIVTGANKFFLVSDQIVAQYGLEAWAHPMFGRSDHVPGVIYDQAVHQANQERGIPTNFIWFKDEPQDNLPPHVQTYLQFGEQQNLHTRYKCRIRSPWYSVPSVYATSVGMLKRCHEFPRLIFNPIQAYTTDTAYRITLKSSNPIHLVYSFVNSFTALRSELEGRHYGGGVLELVPSEVRQLSIPLVEATVHDLRQLDQMLRESVPADEILAIQDRQILKPLGFSDADCETLQTARRRLKSRRQRTNLPQ